MAFVRPAPDRLRRAALDRGRPVDPAACAPRPGTTVHYPGRRIALGQLADGRWYVALLWWPRECRAYETRHRAETVARQLQTRFGRLWATAPADGAAPFAPAARPGRGPYPGDTSTPRGSALRRVTVPARGPETGFLRPYQQ